MRVGRTPIALVAALCCFLSTPAEAQRAIAVPTPVCRSLVHAWAFLAAGAAREAYQTFAQQLSCWRAISPDTIGYIDSERGAMLAALFAGDDVRAKGLLDRIAGEYAYHSPADALVFAGRWSAAFASYRDATHDNSIVNPLPGQPDPVVSAGVASALKGDLSTAITAWSERAAGGGPYDLTALQMALIGIAYARMNDWTAAEHHWLVAARQRQAVPYGSLTSGNITALTMLFHFRGHIARGERRYRWPWPDLSIRLAGDRAGYVSSTTLPRPLSTQRS